MRRPVAVFEMLCVRACMPCSESLGELFAARGASGVIPPSLRRQASVRPPCCRRRDRVPRGADSCTIRYEKFTNQIWFALLFLAGVRRK